ncbi:hypothetical protein D0Y86_18170 [Escherichia coli]|nr:hypothetical protein [Escherichia coli]
MTEQKRPVLTLKRKTEGSRAVILEVSGRWMEAAEAWRRATCVAPRTDWQQFARKRAEHCYRRCRGRV